MNSFTLERTVLPEHLDTLNHVNNVQYLYWIGCRGQHKPIGKP